MKNLTSYSISLLLALATVACKLQPDSAGEVQTTPKPQVPSEASATEFEKCALPDVTIDHEVTEDTAPGVTEADLKIIKQRLESGDRGGVYIR